MMLLKRPLFLLAIFTAASLCPTTSLNAQKVGRKKYENTEIGFEFKPLQDWEFTPIKSSETQYSGKFLEMVSGKPLSVKMAGNQVGSYNLNLFAFRLAEPKSPTTGDTGGGLRGRVEEETKRPSVESLIPKMFSQLRDFEDNLSNPYKEPELKKLSRDMYAKHATYRAFDPNGIDLLIDCWTVSRDDYDLAFLWFVPDGKKTKKYISAFYKSMKSLKFIEIESKLLKKVEGNDDYSSFLAYQQEQAAKTPGWRIVETPTKNFLIVTSSNDKKFIKAVIERLEKSRKLYEKEFPPVKDIEFVSMVRVCSNREEMQRYGNTGGNPAGYFSPSSRELVLYDSRDRNRNETYAVMSHEAFHQYCHFLFEEAEAHRWFDEGHGDYYGCFDMDGRTAKVTAHMPGGLDRLPGIKEMLKADNYIPIKSLIRMNHSQWYNKNSIHNGVASYCQSWSLIYFLRQGMKGKVPSKVWDKAYANIVPDYHSALYQGYSESRERLRNEIEDNIKNAGGEANLDEDTLKRLRNRIRVGEETKNEIWNKATAAAWGEIDMEKFENDWKQFVLKHI